MCCGKGCCCECAVLSANVEEAELPWSMMARAHTCLFQQHGIRGHGSGCLVFLIESTCSTISSYSCVCDFTHKCVAEAHLCVCCGEGCCCDLAACRFLAHAHTHMHAHAHVYGISKHARFTACAHTHVCCTNNECTWSCFRLLWLFRLHVQISFSHPVSLAVLWQILGHVISRRCVLRQHGVCGRGSGLWCSFSKWRVGTRFVMVPVCGVCQWCLVLQTCVLRMAVVP